MSHAKRVEADATAPDGWPILSPADAQQAAINHYRRGTFDYRDGRYFLAQMEEPSDVSVEEYLDRIRRRSGVPSVRAVRFIGRMGVYIAPADITRHELVLTAMIEEGHQFQVDSVLGGTYNPTELRGSRWVTLREPTGTVYTRADNERRAVARLRSLLELELACVVFLKQVRHTGWVCVEEHYVTPEGKAFARWLLQQSSCADLGWEADDLVRSIAESRAVDRAVPLYFVPGGPAPVNPPEALLSPLAQPPVLPTPIPATVVTAFTPPPLPPTPPATANPPTPPATANPPTPAGSLVPDDGLMLDTCMICMDAPPDTLVLPCGHIVVCRSCSDQLRATRDARTCVRCRRPITDVLRDGE